jgi:hypothetical protein
VDETAKTDARAKKIKVQELIDRSLLEALQKDGFLDSLWREK